jgi:dienelactone hydrolase
VLAALREDPAGLRAAVLASPSMPNAPYFASGLAFDRSLAAVVAMCAADGACAAEFPDLDRRLPALLAALDGEPLIVDGLDPAVHAEGRLVLTGELAVQAIGTMLYGRSLSAAIPAAVRALERRDADVVRSMASALAGASAGSQMLLLGLPCIEAVPFDDAAAVATDRARAGIVGRAVANGNVDVCDVLAPVQPEPADATADAHDIPLLAVVGAFDPITPPERVRAAVAELTHAQVVELPAESHQFLGSRDADCGRRLVATFLDDPNAPLDTACVTAMPPLRFVTGLHPTGTPAARIAAIARQPAWLAAAAAALLLLASAPLVAAVGAWRGRRNADRAARGRALHTLSGLTAVALLAMVAAAAWPLVQSMPVAIAFGLPAWVAPWFALAWLLAALGAVLLVATVVGWRRAALSTGSAIHRLLVGLSALGTGLFAAMLGLP